MLAIVCPHFPVIYVICTYKSFAHLQLYLPLGLLTKYTKKYRSLVRFVLDDSRDLHDYVSVYKSTKNTY